MSMIEFNKFAGAVLVTLLTIWVIGMIGDALVHPGRHAAHTPVTSAAKKEAPAARPAAEPAKLASIAPLLATASAEEGAKIARKCATCHSFDEGGKKRVGPNLWNVVNADIAGGSGYSYSKALSGVGGKWTYERLNAFLVSPKDFAKGTKMSFAGLKKDTERAALIAFLRSLSKSPAKLP